MFVITDEERLQGIVVLTAQFRYRICWKGARLLLQERGIDPMRVLQLSCDQGFDVNTSLMLPDGVLVNVDFKEDRKTREIVSINEWLPVDGSRRQVELARQIVKAQDTTQFDRRVERYFDENWREKDASLPPKA